MIPKVEIFENVFPDSLTGHRITFRGQSCQKVLWIITHKIRAPLDSSQPPFWPKWADRAQNSLNVVTLDMSMYTEFGLDRLRFAGFISERLMYLPKK